MLQVMGRHDRLHQQLGHLSREMGGPGNPNPDPQMDMHFNMLFQRKLVAEVVILVSMLMSSSLCVGTS